jgi:16S rRNA (uracil1498-N3)-methyltransferase
VPRFFLEAIGDGAAQITGEDARHIARVLHMQAGRELTVSDTKGTDYLCRILSAAPEAVTVEVISSKPCAAEPGARISLYQAMPKSDKLEFIIQKAVELGACEITPVITSRCISRPGNRAMDRKLERWQRIAFEAAKQCGRGIIPKVNPLLEYEDALAKMAAAELAVLLYEESRLPLSEALTPSPKSAALMVGSEGGFSQAEALAATEKGIAVASLGGRILRCETAPICALSVLLYHLGEL